jgi:hypothetical protein
VRARPVLIAALLLTAALRPTAFAGGAVTTTNTVQRNPCTVTYDQPAGDSSAVDLGQSQPYEPALDVTHLEWRVTSSVVVVVATMPGLGEAPAQSGVGDAFEATMGDGTKQVVFGYFRSRVQGGGPYLFGPAHPQQTSASDPMAKTDEMPVVDTSLLADFDISHHTLTLTLPRADLSTVLGSSSTGFVARTLIFSSFSRLAPGFRQSADNGGLQNPAAKLDISACDRWLVKNGPRKSAPSPCELSFVSHTGDEESPSGTAAPLRPDDVDVASFSYRVTKTDLVVSARVARLTTVPTVGTGRGFTVLLVDQGTQKRISVVQDTRTGLTMSGDVPGSTATVDDARDTVTFTIPRAGLTKAFGRTSLVLADPAVSSFLTVNGSSLRAGDTEAFTVGPRLSLASCDSALRSKA